MEKVKDTISVSTKISRSDKKKLYAIARDLGLSHYWMVQSVLLTILRYCDKWETIPIEHNMLIDAFGLVLHSTIDSHIPISLRNKDKDVIKKAILFIERGEGKRPQLLEVLKDESGAMMESYNYDNMLSSFLSAIDPIALEKLKCKAKDMGHFSITAALHSIIMESANEDYSIEADIKELFSDIRIHSGHSINEDVHYKQGYRKNADEYTTISQKETYRSDL